MNEIETNNRIAATQVLAVPAYVAPPASGASEELPKVQESVLGSSKAKAMNANCET